MLEICIVGKVVAVWQSTQLTVFWSGAMHTNLISLRGIVSERGGNLNGNGISEKDIATRDIQLNEIFLWHSAAIVSMWVGLPALPCPSRIQFVSTL